MINDHNLVGAYYDFNHFRADAGAGPSLVFIDSYSDENSKKKFSSQCPKINELVHRKSIVCIFNICNAVLSLKAQRSCEKKTKIAFFHVYKYKNPHVKRRYGLHHERKSGCKFTGDKVTQSAKTHSKNLSF